MSNVLQDAIYNHSTLNGTARFVFIAIADYADDDGSNAFPAVDTLAAKTGYRDRTIQNSIRKAQDAGELKMIPGAGLNGSNRYVPQFQKLLQLPCRRLTKKCSFCGALASPRGVNITTPRGEPHSPKPPI